MIRLVEAWSDPDTREQATEAILREGEAIPALALARWMHGPEAAVEQLEIMVADGRARVIVDPWAFHPVLGPELRADPRVQAALVELGGMPFAE